MRLGEHFIPFSVAIDAHVTIRGWQTGDGPALLLLHGFPQTHIIWHKIAAKLSETYKVVALDLRGYGQSSKPPGDEEHKVYAKSTMAHDCTVVMDRLGYKKYYVCGHDRGGRVAHKLAINYPDQVMKVMFLDICPTLAMYEATDMVFADKYWHWFFLIQQSPFPEQMILGNPDTMIKKCIRGWTPNSEVFHPEAMKAYTELFQDKQGVHAMCEGKLMRNVNILRSSLIAAQTTEQRPR
jgi:haloacetate dehalogenase